MPETIYFDNIAATPPDEEVVAAMQPYLRQNYGNPSSLHHMGQNVRKAIETARKSTAALIGAQPDEIVFTSNGSEANNLALKGAAAANKRKGLHIITSVIEHYSVLHPLRNLAKAGFRVTYLPVDTNGRVNPKDVEAAIEQDTILVSIMHANNEVGTIQPIEEIGAITNSRGILFHTDAVHTVGKIPVDVNSLKVDLLTLAGQQFYGPKGSGALFVRKKTKLMPLIEGGLQEDGRRAGTPDAAAIAGLGKAAELAKINQGKWSGKTGELEKYLREKLTQTIDDIILTGDPINRVPGHFSMCVQYIEGEGMLLFLDMEGICAASGSACISEALKGSYVLEAMGIEAAISQGSLLITLGKDNTKEEADYFIKVLPPIVGRLRQMSPIYKKKG